MKHVDIFTGTAGMTLALKGISKPVAYCDCKAASQQVINKLCRKRQLPTAVMIDDAQKVAQKVGHVDLVTAGFPCTGFCVCGNRSGFEHPDSKVFHTLVKMCAVMRPASIFLENSPVAYDNVEHRKKIENAFTRLGYNILHCKVSACDVGLPHRRTRWFALAHNKDFGRRLSTRCHKLCEINQPQL